VSLYTFSWFTRRKTPVLKRRPWWNVFGRDTIELREQWERISIYNIPDREARLLKDASAGHWDSPLGTLLVRMMSNPHSIQLEQYGASSAYMPTGGPSAVHPDAAWPFPTKPRSVAPSAAASTLPHWRALPRWALKDGKLWPSYTLDEGVEEYVRVKDLEQWASVARSATGACCATCGQELCLICPGCSMESGDG
jgi:hypothetical protein